MTIAAPGVKRYVPFHPRQRRNDGDTAAQIATTKIVATPPPATLGTVPIHAAVQPDSTAPI